MSVLQKFQRLGLVIVLISIASYALGSQGWAEAGVAAALCVVGWFLTEGGSQRILPQWLTTGLVWAAVLRGLFIAFTGGLDIQAFSEFLLGVIVIKAWDRKASRDWSQVLTLSAFLVIGSVLSSSALGTGLLLAVGVPLMVYGVILLQVCNANERAGAIAHAAGIAPGVPRPWDSRLGRELRRAAMWSLAGGLVLSMVMFFIMPRDIGRGSFGRWLQNNAATMTGFREDVQLGRSGPIYTSRQTVLDMAVHNEKGENLGSPGRIFYLRGATMDTYSPDGSWTKGFEHPLIHDSVPAGLPRNVRERGRYGPVGAQQIIQEFLIRSANSRAPLFSIWQPVSLSPEVGAEFTIDREDLTLVRDQGTPGALRYTIVADPGVPQPAASSARAPGITFPSERIREIASQVLTQASLDPDPATRRYEDDGAAARAVETYLRENFEYSLDQRPIPRGKDPIEWFLDENKQGHCEYFASAMTALLRSVGINARLVSGYVAAEYNATSGHYTVREANAHAWVEVEVRSGDWRQYDPTPPANFRQLHDRPRTLSSDFFGFLDAIQYAWVDSVVNFNEASRLRILGGRGPNLPWFDSAASTVRTRVQNGGLRLATEAVRNGLLAAGAALALGFGVRWAVRRRRGYRRRPSWTASDLPPKEQDRLLEMAAFYEDLLRLWKRAGNPKPLSSAPLTHAGQFAGSRTAEDASARLANLFYKVRFGRQSLSEAEAGEVRRDLQSLEAVIRARGLSGGKAPPSPSVP